METINFGKYPVVSQNPELPSSSKKEHSESYYLPELVRAWDHIETTTGIRWRCTSYWRSSPSHQHGVSMDIAPEISPDSAHLYAVSKGSDPVLYKREKLIRKLQLAARTFSKGPYLVGVFIEPDHLHLQVLDPTASPKNWSMRIIKWKIAKPVYSDTEERMALPLIK